MEVWVSLATVLVGALATGILTYVNVRSRARTERAIEDRVKARDLRLPHYRRLFEVTRLIARLPAEDVDSWRSKPLGAAGRLEEWYFEDGAGLFLTREARVRFFDLFRALEDAASSVQPGGRVPHDEAHKICVHAEQLRTQLTLDMTIDVEAPHEPAATGAESDQIESQGPSAGPASPR